MFMTGRQSSGIGRRILDRGYLLLAFVILPFCLSGPAQAEHDQSFTVQGFGTLGAVRTSSDEVEFVRDITQPRGARTGWDGRVDSILGLQANWRIGPELEAVIQGVSRYRYDRSFNPEVSLAFLKYDPTPSLSLRAGRLGTEFFMMADSRLVGYSFLTVRPPGDYFWYLPFYSINGADVALSLPVGDHLLRGKLFYGNAYGKIPLAERQWEIDGSPMMGGYLEAQFSAWLMRLSYANIRFQNDLPIADEFSGNPAFAPYPTVIRESLDFLKTANTRSHYYSFGLTYDQGPWQLQFMLNYIDQGSNAFQSSYGGYALAGYRLDQVTPYLGYSWVRSRERDGAINPGVASVMAYSGSDQTTGIVGARWDVARNIALKAQWDAVRGEPRSIFPYRRETASWDGKLDVFSVTLDFVF
jgi:hypothetical protein